LLYCWLQLPLNLIKNVAIQAQDAGDFKDPVDYLEKVATTAAKIGLITLDKPERKTIAGITFFRQDYYSPKGTFYQTHVSTIYKEYVLDFILSAADNADIKRLFNSLNSLQFGAKEK
jgi:hypothetical protein